MTTPAPKPLRVFCSYSHRDEEHLNDLRDWVRGLERQGLIEWWHDREISPGWEWEEAIDKNLRTADIILLLVSPAFMASDYVYEKEIGKAIERHERGEARVIPIIVRPAHWKWAPFGKLQALPKDAKPITTWPNRDEAWFDVVEGIQKAVEELLDERQERAAAEERYREALEQAWADEKLTDAELERLSALASELGLGKETATDIERDVMGDAIEAVPERQVKERRNRLDELYAQARRSHQNQEWQAVVDIFEQIRAEDPDYPDRPELLATARKALDRQQRMQRVAVLYDQGLRYIEDEDWPHAIQCFRRIRELEPGYRDTEALLSQVRQKLAPPPTVEVPDLSGKQAPQARDILASKELKLIAQNEVSSDTIPEGRIIEQIPEAGTKVEVGSSVSVTVSSGSQEATITDDSNQSTTQTGQPGPPPEGQLWNKHSMHPGSGEDRQPPPRQYSSTESTSYHQTHSPSTDEEANDVQQSRSQELPSFLAPYRLAWYLTTTLANLPGIALFRQYQTDPYDTAGLETVGLVCLFAATIIVAYNRPIDWKFAAAFTVLAYATFLVAEFFGLRETSVGGFSSAIGLTALAFTVGTLPNALIVALISHRRRHKRSDSNV